MAKQDSLKEHIIETTIAFIQQSSGDIHAITTRAIAEKANVGIGLINYHFQSKENLIMICVQRIIEQVVLNFQPAKNYASNADKLAESAIRVFDFLFENNAISRLSILGDMNHYTESCNSVQTQKGFAGLIADSTEPQDTRLLAFMLTAVMQVAFLANSACLSVIGYDMENKEQRHAFIRKITTALYQTEKWSKE